MKFILEALILNKFRSHTPLGFYNLIKGHTGVDLNYHFEELPSPVSGKVIHIAAVGGDQLTQTEMGNVIYLDDQEMGNIHVFAHMSKINVNVGEHVALGQILGITGNTGSKTTVPHLHYEILTFHKPDKNRPTNYDSLFNPIMSRSLDTFVGWNIDPQAYLRILYGKYHLNIEGMPIK